jgi:anti-sigma B factor antagonist
MMLIDAPLDVLEIEQVNQATIVRFRGPALIGTAVVETVADKLFRLLQSGCSHLVLNLENVEDMTSDMVGYLLAVYRRARSTGGRLVLCRLHPELQLLFRRLSLQRLFPMCDTEEEALQSI